MWEIMFLYRLRSLTYWALLEMLSLSLSLSETDWIKVCKSKSKHFLDWISPLKKGQGASVGDQKNDCRGI
jgi:hypothetical protein